jgi:hypothetical protein
MQGSVLNKNTPWPAAPVALDLPWSKAGQRVGAKAEGFESNQES